MTAPEVAQRVDSAFTTVTETKIGSHEQHGRVE